MFMLDEGKRKKIFEVTEPALRVFSLNRLFLIALHCEIQEMHIQITVLKDAQSKSFHKVCFEDLDID